jgi:L-histidine Nalpha-methyltransferase / hercynylcysteine S-oxide synthase
MDVTSTAIDILDIRSYQDGAQKPEYDLVDVLVKGLKAPLNEKRFPTILLWDERGLELYDKVTTEAPEYYLFAAESEILREHASEIVQIIQSRLMPNNTQVLLELGAG